MDGYSLFREPIEAEFVERLNRFVLICRTPYGTVKAYLPNPGRLWELLLPGAPLIVEPARKKAASLPFTVVAVKRDGNPVMLHTHRTNSIAAYLIEHGMIEGLEGFRVAKEEVCYGDSRFDLLLESEDGRRLLTEVKSVTLFSRTLSMFPDAPTVRGVKHLKTLGALREDSLKGMVLFVVFSDRVRYFLPEFHVDPLFADTLMEVRDRVDILPIALGLTEALKVKPPVRRLAIPWEVLERESADSGVYMLTLRATEPERVTIGDREVRLKEGYYIYAGSARRGLTKRIARHMRRRKRLFWHIDYIREATELVKAIPIRTQDTIECELAGRLSHLFSPLKGLGSSDCSCRAHLFYSPQDPLSMPEFVSLILHYRMDRVVDKISKNTTA